MADLTVRELKTDMDGHFTELRAEMNARFAEVKTEMNGRFADVKTEMNGRFAEVKTEMNGRFADVKTEMDSRFAAVDRRFDRLEARFEGRLREEHLETRRHFDIVAESLRAEIKLRFEGTDATLDNHERRIRALEKGRK